MEQACTCTWGNGPRLQHVTQNLQSDGETLTWWPSRWCVGAVGRRSLMEEGLPSVEVCLDPGAYVDPMFGVGSCHRQINHAMQECPDDCCWVTQLADE